MSSVNKVTLIGNLGKDPEIRYVKENIPVATFTMATTEAYKDKNGEWQDATEWHNIVVWRHLAERAEKFFKKGTQVYVEGKIRSRSYDDKDGVKRYITEIVADQVFNTGKREGSGSNEGANHSQSVPSGYEQYTGLPDKARSNSGAASTESIKIDDDLPF
jgi:single-strand DNA-binding protein